MSKIVKIAVDAMGGDNSPKKVIDGISTSLKSNSENYFYLLKQNKKTLVIYIKTFIKKCSI